MDIENLKKHYPGMNEEDIEKANTMIYYAIYDKSTGEIVQNGDMDLLSFDKFIPTKPTQGKVIIPSQHFWKLRGEFIDDEGKHMFRINQDSLETRTEHVDKVNSMRMLGDKD